MWQNWQDADWLDMWKKEKRGVDQALRFVWTSELLDLTIHWDGDARVWRGNVMKAWWHTPSVICLWDTEIFLFRRQLEIMRLKFRREVGIRVIAKWEIVVGIINSTGINPRDIFAVIQALGKNSLMWTSGQREIKFILETIRQKEARALGRILWSFHLQGLG